MAQQRGKLATFMPKPFGHLTGNGCHFHISLWDKAGKKNLFEDAKDAYGYGLSDDGLPLHRRPDPPRRRRLARSWRRRSTRTSASASARPTPGATWSPAYAAWGGNNRTQMIRVPGGARIEHRGIDGSANPYLAATAMLAAGLDGIERKLDPGPQNTANLYTATAQEIRRKRIKSLPTTLADATGALRKDAVLRDWFGHTGTEHYSDYFADTKLREFQEWHSEVSRVGGRPLPDAVLGSGASRALGRRRRPSAARSRAATSTRSGRTSAAAAGSVDVGLNRLRFEPGKRPTPAHDHGAEEEIFYVLAGSGLSWRAGETHEVRAGDCLVYLPGRGRAHADRGRRADGRARVRRARGRPSSPPAARGRAVGGAVWVDDAVAAGHPWEREAAAGPLPMPERSRRGRAGSCTATTRPSRSSERPGRSYVSAASARPRARARPACGTSRSRPDSNGWPRHCHAAEEELFVILAGAGTVRIGDEEAPVRAGHVISRPAGTGARALVPRRARGPRVPRLRAAPPERHLLLPRLRQGHPLGRRRDRAHRAARTTGTGRTCR